MFASGKYAGFELVRIPTWYLESVARTPRVSIETWRAVVRELARRLHSEDPSDVAPRRAIPMRYQPEGEQPSSRKKSKGERQASRVQKRRARVDAVAARRSEIAPVADTEAFVLPDGKHRGRRLGELSDCELGGVNGRYNMRFAVEDDTVAANVKAEIARRREARTSSSSEAAVGCSSEEPDELTREYLSIVG